MRKHVVQQGECLATIAARYEIRPWTLIYDAPENAEFRRKRPNPNVIYRGDELVIPDLRRKEEAGPTEQRHRFKVKGDKRRLRIQFRDEDGNPLDRFAWKLRDGDEVLGEGRTDTKGLFELALADDVRAAVLEMGGYTWPLRIDHLDPITRVSGVQQRLANLGHNPGPVDGVVGEKTTAAVLAFQSQTPGLKATGRIDDALRRALLDTHDSDSELRPAEEEMSPTTAPTAPPPSMAEVGPGGAGPSASCAEAPFPCEVPRWLPLDADEDVRTRAIQQRLRHLGIHPGPVDGIYGPLTRTAVEEFQAMCTECAGTPPEIIDSGPVDGIAGPLTRRALESAAGKDPYG